MGMKGMKIALTGGIASGKSTVARMFAGLGADILDADSVARDAVKPNSPGCRALFELLGAEYFAPDGELDRHKLRELIIRDAGVRSRVNAALHPVIFACMDREWERIRAADPDAVVIFDIPLLFESGSAGFFDTIILVYVPAKVQVDRLMQRDGLTRPEAENTLTMQLPIESKKARAHFVIDNSADIESTRRQVLSLWKKISPTACD